MKFQILLFLLIILTNPIKAEGDASIMVAHRGREFRLYKYAEFLTGKTELIDRKSPGADSCLKFSPGLKTGEWLVLANDVAKTTIFVAPGDSLFVVVPQPDSLTAPSLAGEPEVTPIFPDTSRMGSNRHLIRFNEIIRTFYATYARRLQKPKTMRETLDSLKKVVVTTLPVNMEQGVKDHIRYTLATLEDIILPNKMFLHARYFGNHIRWRCPAYFNYLKIFFKDYLYTLTLEENGKNILQAINISSSLEVLDSAFIKADKYRLNDTLRNIVILNGLYEVYFQKNFDKLKIDRILEQIKLKARHPAISVMAGNVIDLCWYTANGASLPLIQLEREDGRKFPSDSLSGKKTLITFFASWSKESMQDMLLLQKLHQKYGQRIRFVSILSDGEREKTLKWKREAKINWEFFYDEKKKNCREKWHIRKIPHYMLLDDDGDILKFDAPGPDENLELLLKNELKKQKP